MTITVRACDITKARESEGGRCPIACSIRREHHRGVPCMAADWIWVDGLGDCELPRSAQEFVKAFDRGQATKLPFKFVINPVKPGAQQQMCA